MLVQKQGFFKRAEPAGQFEHLALWRREQVELSVAFEVSVTSNTDAAVTKLCCRLSWEWYELTQVGLLLSFADGELQADFWRTLSLRVGTA